LILALPCSAFAGAGAGTSAASFLKLGAGPEHVATGGAATAEAAGALASYWNPAGLARLAKDREAAFSRAKWAGELSHLYAVFAKRITRSGGTAGFSLTRLGTSQEGYDAADNPTGKFSTNDLALGAALAGGLEAFPHASFRSERFVYWGAGLKIIYQRVPGASAWGVAVDGGVQTAALETAEVLVRVGAAARNWGPAMSLSGPKAPLPGFVAGGAAAELKEWGLRAALDLAWARDDGFGPRVGAGWRPAEAVELRLGWRGDAGAEGMGALTFGGGVVWKGLGLDVAMLRQGDLGESLNLGMRYAW